MKKNKKSKLKLQKRLLKEKALTEDKQVDKKGADTAAVDNQMLSTTDEDALKNREDTHSAEKVEEAKISEEGPQIDT
jgi:hypothetical protein